MIPSEKTHRALFIGIFLLLTARCIIQLKMTKSASKFNTTTVHHTSSLTKKTIYGPSLKYLLQWRKPCKEPYTSLQPGTYTFLERHCPVNNCYVTSDKTYLSDITHYNAILFYNHALSDVYNTLPRNRSCHQRYVFVSAEAAASQPYIYHKVFRAIFNITWTYRLNSDVYYGSIIIKNKKGEIVGPKEVMHWPNVTELGFIDEELKKKLSNKSAAAAWFVTDCQTSSKTWKYATQLAKELAVLNEELDIYGDCDAKNLTTSNVTEFLSKLKSDYYFYLSFEDAWSEDYVTEKLLHALQHNTVPIVYGGANYTRFMPKWTYLNAKILNPVDMAKTMVNLMRNKDKYYQYFKWHNAYIYEHAGSTPDADPYCSLCKKLNDADTKHQVTIYKDITRWWRGRDLPLQLAKVL